MDIKEFFKQHKNIVVALSGGVDSAVLLYFAKKYANSVQAVFVKTEFQPEFEKTDAEKICKALDVKLNIINASIIDNKSITQNSKERCYYCKSNIFNHICNFAKAVNANVVEGTNADDDINDRPGYKALCEMNVLSPLRICGYTKADIRKIAKSNNLPVYDKPSYACLATRIPCGTEITNNILNTTEKAEEELLKLDFNDFRIRYRNGDALLELSSIDREKYLKDKDKFDNILKKYYSKISLSEEIRNGTGQN